MWCTNPTLKKRRKAKDFIRSILSNNLNLVGGKFEERFWTIIKRSKIGLGLGPWFKTNNNIYIYIIFLLFIN